MFSHGHKILFRSLQRTYFTHLTKLSVPTHFQLPQTQKNYFSKMASPEDLYPEAHAIVKKFYVTDEQSREIMNLLTKEINKGLGKATHPTSIVKCWITYVQKLPTGRERGKFLALDLGGTNFRVLMVTINSETEVDIENDTYKLDEELITGPGNKLFDKIAECLSTFVVNHKVKDEVLPLGFTFSFPVRQLGLDKGVLISWTKGFNCSGVVGQDVVTLLQEAIQRRGDLKINIVAILNDTTGTLMSCAWKYPNCRIGLIVGTGCNACYVEKIHNVENFEDPGNNKPDMIINCEWGAFGSDGAIDFIRTEFDKEIDGNTFNKGKQYFEKCISGMYLGEMARMVIVQLMDRGEIFEGQQSDLLHEKWKFPTNLMSQIESDEPGSYVQCIAALTEFGIKDASAKDLGAVRYICSTILNRSARLVAAGLACLTRKMNEPNITIGVDGSVYRYYPNYHDLVVKHMKKLLDPSQEFRLVLSEDGSGRGAALIAAVSNEKKRKCDCDT